MDPSCIRSSSFGNTEQIFTSNVSWQGISTPRQFQPGQATMTNVTAVPGVRALPFQPPLVGQYDHFQQQLSPQDRDVQSLIYRQLTSDQVEKQERERSERASREVANMGKELDSLLDTKLQDHEDPSHFFEALRMVQATHTTATQEMLIRVMNYGLHKSMWKFHRQVLTVVDTNHPNALAEVERQYRANYFSDNNTSELESKWNNVRVRRGEDMATTWTKLQELEVRVAAAVPHLCSAPQALKYQLGRCITNSKDDPRYTDYLRVWEHNRHNDVAIILAALHAVDRLHKQLDIDRSATRRVRSRSRSKSPQRKVVYNSTGRQYSNERGRTNDYRQREQQAQSYVSGANTTASGNGAYSHLDANGKQFREQSQATEHPITRLPPRKGEQWCHHHHNSRHSTENCKHIQRSDQTEARKEAFERKAEWERDIRSAVAGIPGGSNHELDQFRKKCPTLMVKVNGSEPLRAYIDTGSSAVIINPKLVRLSKKLKLNSFSTPVDIGTHKEGSVGSAADGWAIMALQIGSLSLVAPMIVSSEFAVPMVISYDFAKEFIVQTWDFPEQRVILQKTGEEVDIAEHYLSKSVAAYAASIQQGLPWFVPRDTQILPGHTIPVAVYPDGAAERYRRQSNTMWSPASNIKAKIYTDTMAIFEDGDSGEVQVRVPVANNSLVPLLIKANTILCYSWSSEVQPTEPT
jgi:hypothetical protein